MIVLSAAAALYIFAALVVLSLDAETVRQKLAESARASGVELSIDSLSLSFPFAINMDGVTISDPATRSALILDKIHASVAVWRFFILQPAFSVDAVSGAGTVSLVISPSLFSGTVSVKADAHAFPLDKAIRTSDAGGLPLSALLDMKAGFSFFPLAPEDVQGTAQLTLNELKFKPNSQWATFLAGFEPRSAACVIKAGAKRLETDGCGIETSAGNLDLRSGASLIRNLGSSPLEGAIVLSPTGSLSDALATLYGKNRKPDGKYYFSLGGILGSPDVRM